jgi:7-carboxy-7-deazaguanine synthase
MRVSEIFYSLQGEGMLVGTPSVFVRLAGCPLRCSWCDTKYAWDFEAGEDLEPAQIVEQISRWSCKFIVLTGGEPMMGPDLAARPGLGDLTRSLKVLGKHITVETAGVLFIPDLACDLISISPKLAASGSVTSDLNAIRRLIRAYPYQLKFVIESPEDIGAAGDRAGHADAASRDDGRVAEQIADGYRVVQTDRPAVRPAIAHPALGPATRRLTGVSVSWFRPSTSARCPPSTRSTRSARSSSRH